MRNWKQTVHVDVTHTEWFGKSYCRNSTPHFLTHGCFYILPVLTYAGDDRYRVRTLSSHDVTAATLIIQPLDVAQYPVKFVTLFSVKNEPFQYQLDTIIHQQTVLSRDRLDGIIWLRTPPANISFSLQVSSNGIFMICQGERLSKFPSYKLLMIVRGLDERSNPFSTIVYITSFHSGRTKIKDSNVKSLADAYSCLSVLICINVIGLSFSISRRLLLLHCRLI